MVDWRRLFRVMVPVKFRAQTKAPATAEEAHCAKLERIILALPKITRDIFIARRFHGLSVAEICERTGLSHKQVMRHLTRAVEHLHEALQADPP